MLFCMVESRLVAVNVTILFLNSAACQSGFLSDAGRLLELNPRGKYYVISEHA